ncbi:MAG: amino acid racemase [Puniceicoccales bacterium]|jgi:aspartate racemase|nr:amino acid racemase [Puniceicoccales bacterium]
MIFGIIGGNGVAATNKLLELIENKYTENGAFRDAHHPEMLIYQATQAPSRSMFLEGRGESFIGDYVEVGKKLKNAGATTLCMCCNTAYYAIEILQKEIGLPFINLIAEVVRVAKNTGEKNIGLAAAVGCLAGKVYEKQFAALFPEVNIIYPDAAMQKEVTRGIVNVKNKNRFLPDDHSDRPKNIFQNVYEH